MIKKNEKILSIVKKTNIERLKNYEDKYPFLQLRKVLL